MLHNPDNCQEVDCQECQDLVDSGLVYSCDACGKCLRSCDNEHTYHEEKGQHQCHECLIKEKNKCYNYLVAEYLNSSDKAVFLNLKAKYETPDSFRSATPESEFEQISNNLSCYRSDIALECLEKLISIFDIKITRTVGLSGFIPRPPFAGYITSSYITSG